MRILFNSSYEHFCVILTPHMRGSLSVNFIPKMLPQRKGNLSNMHCAFASRFAFLSASRPSPSVVCKKFPSYFINGSMGAFEPDSFDWTAPLQNVTTPKSKLYGLLWQEYRTVPLWLLIIVFPLISLKSPTFFTKFNALGKFQICLSITRHERNVR